MHHRVVAARTGLKHEIAKWLIAQDADFVMTQDILDGLTTKGVTMRQVMVVLRDIPGVTRGVRDNDASGRPWTWKVDVSRVRRYSLHGV